MSGPFLCSIFMNLVGSNGFFIFLLFFHALIGFFGIYRMRIRQTVENPDSQFVAMPSTITPAGIELNPTTEPIEEPKKLKRVNLQIIFKHIDLLHNQKTKPIENYNHLSDQLHQPLLQ